MTCDKINGIVAINVNGISSKLDLNLIDTFLSDYKVICLTETLTNDITLTNTLLEDYCVFSSTKKFRKSRYGGIHGISILVPSLLAEYCKLALNESSSPVLWLYAGAEVLGTEMIIGAVYLPCENSKYNSPDLFDLLRSDIYDLASKFDIPMCLIGDFNCRTGLISDFMTIESEISELCGLDDGIEEFNDFYSLCTSNNLPIGRFNCDMQVNKHGRQLIENCQALDLKIVNGRFGSDKNVGQYTCYSNGESTVDYAVVTHSLYAQVSDFTVHSFDKCYSDAHCPISISFNSQNNCCSTKKQENPNLKLNENPDLSENPLTDHTELSVSWDFERLSFNWKDNSTEYYRNELNNEVVSDLEHNLEHAKSNPTQEGINQFCNHLKEVMINSAKKHRILKPVTLARDNNSNPVRKNKQWFDTECYEARRQYSRLKNRLKRSNALANNEESRSELSLAAKAYKKLIVKKKETYFATQNQLLKRMKTNNSHEYWKIINKCSSSKSKPPNIDLNTFAQHFKKLSTVDTCDVESFDLELIMSGNANEWINMPFSQNEINDCIKRLRSHKASGIDNIHNEFLKACPPAMINIFVGLFNLVLDSGIIPPDWTVGLIMPLYKNKGSSTDPDNYRGITLLSCLGKLFTSVINHRLTNFLDAVGAMGDEQAGFRADHSTLDHIFTLHSIINFYLQKHQRLYCAFIDYKKAFDLIDRSKLWHKLLSNGLNGRIIRVIHNLYYNAKSSVMSCGQLSDTFSCNIGVRQGENLSPLLFALYLNDFERFVSRHYAGLKDLAAETSEALSDDDVEVFFKLYVLLYADDTIVMAESAEELQRALDAIKNYCNLWKLTVNTSKTKIVIFARGKIRKKPTFKFGDDQLEICDDYIYLGTQFNFNGSFTKAQNKQITQARKAAFVLIKKIQCLQLPLDTQCELFDQLVVPILLYGSEVWGFRVNDSVERFHRWFMKYILKLKIRTPSNMVYGELGRCPLKVNIQCRMVNFWARIITGSSHKLSNIMFRVTKALHENRSNNLSFPWIEHIHLILNQAGMSNIWNEDPSNIKKVWLKHTIKLRLQDIYRQNWSEVIINDPQYAFYKIFKKELIFERYLTKIDNHSRLSLLKYRCKNHYLPVSNENQESKVCVLCDKNNIGDEFHYILECGYFRRQRSQYLGQSISPNIISLSKIFSEEDTTKLLKLSKFCRIISNSFKCTKKTAASNVATTDATISNTQHVSSRGRIIIKPNKLNL